MENHEEHTAATLNLHLQQLVYLREVARRSSMAVAAEALNVSQPALSQALTELGRRLGVPLFQRDGRRRRLTEAGREVLRYAEDVLGGADALARRLGMLRNGEGGTLVVGMIDAASLYLLPETVLQYREDHPSVDLKLTVDSSNELLRRLRAFELDLAFVVGPLHEPGPSSEAGLSSKEVLREPLHIYLPSGDAGDPETARWVLYPEGSRTRRIIDDALARAGIRPAVVLESDNPAVLRQMVAMGLGWSVLPPAVGEVEVGSSRVQRGRWLTERALHAVQRQDPWRDPRVEAFLGLALEHTRA